MIGVLGGVVPRGVVNGLNRMFMQQYLFTYLVAVQFLLSVST